MHLRRWPLVWLAVVTVLATAHLLLPLAATAQAANQVIINYQEAVDTPDKFGVTLRVFFTLLDNAQQVAVTNAQIDSAKFVLDAEDGGTYDTKVSKASGPISVVLVLDASGSMYNQMKNIQQAAISLVNSLPAESRFAVVQFNDKVQTIQQLTNDKNSIVNAIGGIKAGGQTCLFDAAFQGVQVMSTAPAGRRAVVVFSGNKDQIYNKPCSKKTPADIINAATARESRTPIYTIGLRGFQPIAEAELRNIADSTGGTASFGNNPQSLFNDTVNSLNAQYVAEALVSPKQGDRRFALRLALAGGANPNDVSGSFPSPHDYSVKPTATPTITPTPLPAQVVISTIQQDPDTKEFVVEVSVVSEDQITEYHFDLISPTGTLQSQVTKQSPLNGPVRMPIGKLEAGEYAIRVSAIGKNGQIIARSESARVKYDPTPTVTPTATHTPMPVSATITSIGYENPAVKDKVVIKLALSGQEQIAKLKAIFANADTNLTIREFDSLPVNTDLTLNIADMPSVAYNVTVIAFGSGGQQLSTSSQKFTYDYVPPTATPSPTPEPTDFGYQLGKRVAKGDPLVLGVFGVIVLGLLGVLAVLFLRKPKKAATGTGFLREMTGAVDVSELAGYAKARSEEKNKPAAAPPHAPAAPAASVRAQANRTTDYDKTAAVNLTRMPASSLSVERSRDNTYVGKSIPVTHVPFTLGRRERDLSFENDPGVSREHAQITYENNTYFITDNGSTNHTFVDEVDIGAHSPRPLYNGAAIRLGTSTVMTFRIEESSGYDSDKTMPDINY